MGVALALALAAPGCGHGRARAHPVAWPSGKLARPVLALFPFQNLTGGRAPGKQLLVALEIALRQRGLEIAAEDITERALAKYRIRYTGGLDHEAAKALREELGVDGVLIASVDVFSAASPPKLAVTVRLVSATEEPAVLWIDTFARAGDDAPGLLGLGLVSAMKDLEREAMSELAGSLVTFLDTGDFGGDCASGRRFRPRIAFRSPLLDDVEGRRSIAVLPFQNQTGRRDAGEAIVVQFVKLLSWAKSFEVIEPGVVRSELLALRIILDGGVSLDAARVVLDGVRADLVLSGSVRAYEDDSGRAGAPKVEFTAYILDRRTSEIVWSSTSRGEGDDGVFFFGAGKVTTSSALACRMTRGVVDQVNGSRSATGSRDAIPAPGAEPGARFGTVER